MDPEQIHNDDVSRFEQIVTLNQQAFAAERYETAYHLLAAALHSAYDLRDLERLALIKTLATEQADYIDAYRLEHPLSATSANKRGNPALFRTLSRDASHRLVLVRSERLTGASLDTEEGT